MPLETGESYKRLNNLKGFCQAFSTEKNRAEHLIAAREINILCYQEDENGGRLWEGHPPTHSSKSGLASLASAFAGLGFVPGQSDSPYLITISLITKPRIEYYTMQNVKAQLIK